MSAALLSALAGIAIAILKALFGTDKPTVLEERDVKGKALGPVIADRLRNLDKWLYHRANDS